MPVIELNCSIANALAGVSPDAQIDFVVWRRLEQDAVRAAVPGVGHVYCYEEFLASDRSDWPSHLERVATGYPEVNWSGVIASERSFTDYSFLLSGAGHRTESYDYVQRLLVNTVRFFESVFAGSVYDAVVCQTADSFFTHVLFKVAQHFGAKMFAISPAWLQEDGKPGCFFTNDEYMRCDRMIAAYRKLLSQTLTPEQIERVDRFRQAVVGFDGNKAFYSVNKRSFGRNPLSPNIRRLPGYIFQNLRKDKNLDYIRIDPVAKVRANVMRLWRFWRCRFLVGGTNTPVPHKAVFFALHFQPEQSTLVGGIYYANQVALVENIAKSLPLGYTLVLKEHPAGRGARPAWQYRHLASFPNIIFCDAPSKVIARQVGAVVTITGTIGLEALALDKPTIVLGRTFFDYSDLFYKPSGVLELPALFRSLLIDGEYQRRPNRSDLIRKTLLSYLGGLVASYPVPAAGEQIARALNDHFAFANLGQSIRKEELV